MTEQDIGSIEAFLKSLEEKEEVKRVETHASWVLITRKTAYKFKKPVDLGFLDFSTLEKRKHYCEEELHLNRRLASEIYLGMVRVVKKEKGLALERAEEEGNEAYGYGVMMKRMDPKKKMDELLKRHEVRYRDVEAIARQLAPFHRKAEKVDPPPRSMLSKSVSTISNKKDGSLRSFWVRKLRNGWKRP